MNKLFLLIVSILVLGGGFFYFKTNRLTMTKKSVSEVISPSESKTQSASAKEFTMTAKQWAFNPSVITVKQGDKVKITIKSLDVTHGFALPDFNVKVDLTPGVEQTVEFTADKKGEFTFFCSVLCGQGHREMKGKLIVE